MTDVLLQQILEQLCAIRAALEGRQRNALTQPDSELLSRLLPAAAGLYGSQPFRLKELLSDKVIQAMTAPLSASAVGTLLSRAASRKDTSSTGYVISRVGTEHAAALWQILKVVTPYPRLPEALGVALPSLETGSRGTPTRL